MTQLPELPQIFKELEVKGVSVFLILTRKALAENLKTDEVLNLLKLANNKLPKIQDRIEKMQIKYDILKYEIEEREDLL
jgi:predicted transcriptional regulator